MKFTPRTPLIIDLKIGQVCLLWCGTDCIITIWNPLETKKYLKSDAFNWGLNLFFIENLENTQVTTLPHIY